MKSLHLRLVTEEGDELDSIAVDEFVIAEAWDEFPPGESEEDIIERVDALYRSLLRLLRERQAAPRRGFMWLKLALGEALLTADETPGDDMVVEVTVRPLAEGEDDEFDESAS
jgi:hypothetical protein